MVKDGRIEIRLSLLSAILNVVEIVVIPRYGNGGHEETHELRWYHVK